MKKYLLMIVAILGFVATAAAQEIYNPDNPGDNDPTDTAPKRSNAVISTDEVATQLVCTVHVDSIVLAPGADTVSPTLMPDDEDNSAPPPLATGLQFADDRPLGDDDPPPPLPEPYITEPGTTPLLALA